MPSFYRAVFVLLSLTLLGFLGSCHRASYQFQACAERHETEVLTVATRVDSSVPLPEKVELHVRGKGLLAAARTRSTHKARGTGPIASRQSQVFSQKPLEILKKPSASTARQQQPDPPVRYARKGVAFALAVLLGFFGAHLFYIGDRRRGLRYLFITLAGIALAALAFPIANLAIFGGGWAGLLVGVTLLVLGAGAILSVYFRALLDGFRILLEGV
jgi:TM2 domain-containing membrane protein YozV